MTKQLEHIAVAVSFAFACAGLAAVAAGATTPAENAKSTTKTSITVMSDSEFAKSAAEGGLAQIRFGELAEDRGSSKAVKDLGQRMVDDHTKADDNLKAAASKNNISVPTQLSAKDQVTYAHLSELSGTAFDRAYARDLVREHESDIAAFRHEANDGKDASIKSFASQTLPTLEDHLKLARQTLETVYAKASSHIAKKQS